MSPIWRVGHLAATTTGRFQRLGTWRKLAGPATAGALHVLDSPARVYDSRPGELPVTGPKTRLADGAVRPISCAAPGPVPLGASAVLINLTVAATSAAGWVALFKGGTAWPGNSSVNWFQANTVIGNMAVVALDGSAGFNVKANINCSTDFLVDVLGYYR